MGEELGWTLRIGKNGKFHPSSSTLPPRGEFPIPGKCFWSSGCLDFWEEQQLGHP